MTIDTRPRGIKSKSRPRRGVNAALATALTLAACGATERSASEQSNTGGTRSATSGNTGGTAGDAGFGISGTSGSSGGAPNMGNAASNGGSGPGGSGGRASSGGSGGAGGSDGGASAGGSGGGVAMQEGGAAGAEPTSCDGCEACPGDGVFVECDPPRLRSCICERPDSENAAGYETLSSCTPESPCPPARYEVHGGPTGTWSDEACLFAALDGRTAGRYEFHYDFSDLSYQYSHWLLVVTSEGDVSMSLVTTTGAVGSTTASRYYGPFERCALRESSFFEGCQVDPTPCYDVRQWMRDCTEVPAECPE